MDAEGVVEAASVARRFPLLRFLSPKQASQYHTLSRVARPRLPGVGWDGAGLRRSAGPNKRLQPTPASVRSCLAPAARRA